MPARFVSRFERRARHLCARLPFDSVGNLLDVPIIIQSIACSRKVIVVKISVLSIDFTEVNKGYEKRISRTSSNMFAVFAVQISWKQC